MNQPAFLRVTVCGGAIAIAVAGFALGATPNEARVTQIVRDVRVLPTRASARPASLNETVRQGTGVRTGGDSRAELTFGDQSLTRLGANTAFSFEPGAREVNLTSGVLLICVPAEAGTFRINAPAVSVAISGGVAMAETHKNSWTKIIVIEGHALVTIKSSGATLRLNAGDMITLASGAKRFSKVEHVSLKTLTDRSLLIQFAPLPRWVWRLIDSEVKKQQASLPPGGLKDPMGFDAIDQRAATLPHERVPVPKRDSGPR